MERFQEPTIPLRESREAVQFSSLLFGTLGFFVGAVVGGSEIVQFYLALVFG